MGSYNPKPQEVQVRKPPRALQSSMAGFEMEPDAGVWTRAPSRSESVSPWPWHYAKHRQLSYASEQFYQEGTSIIPDPQVGNSGLGSLNNPTAWACVAHVWQRRILNSGLCGSKAQVLDLCTRWLPTPTPAANISETEEQLGSASSYKVPSREKEPCTDCPARPWWGLVLWILGHLFTALCH